MTKVLADETRSTRLQNSEPHVIVTLEPSRYVNFFNVVIENVGAGPAFYVQISFSPDITFKRGKEGKSLSTLSLMTIPTLKSKQKISSFVAKFDAFTVRQSTAVCKCTDAHGVEHAASNSIDIDVYTGMSTLGSDNLEKIAYNIEKISRTVEQVTSGFSRINVNSHTSQDRADEVRAWEEHRARFAADQNASEESSTV